MPQEPAGAGGGGQYCFQWGKDSAGQPLYWGKDYPGWSDFRKWLIDHSVDVNGWIDAHPAAATCIAATKDQAPPPPPSPSPPPAAKQYCFTWFDQKWGKDYPGWTKFKAALQAHNVDPDSWARAHPDAAKCIGAKVKAYCFQWFDTYWGKDYPGWDAFGKALDDHGVDRSKWITAHPDAAKCIGAPALPPQPPQPPAGGGTGPTGGPPAQPPAYNADGTPWQGRGIYTTVDPMLALNFRPGCVWAAVMPQSTSPDQVAQLQAAGFAVSAWEGDPTDAGAAFAVAYCDGYIGQAENQPQLDAAVALAGQLGALPKALVTNNFMTAFPAGWVAHVEAYENEQANISVGGMIQNALNRGASVVVPIVGIYAGQLGNPGAQHYLDELASMAITAFGAYEAGSMPPGDIARWADPTPGTPAPGSTGAGPGSLPSTGVPSPDQGGPASSSLGAPGQEAGGWSFYFPVPLTASPERYDQGIDWALSKEHPFVYAVSDGDVYAVHPNPTAGGFGASVYYKLRAENTEIYVGHGQPIVKQGDHVKAGQAIVATRNPPYGDTSDPYHTEVGLASGTAPKYALLKESDPHFADGGWAFRKWLQDHRLSGPDVPQVAGAPPPKQPPPSPSPAPSPGPSGSGGSVAPLPTSAFQEPPPTRAAWEGFKRKITRGVPSTDQGVVAIIGNPRAWLR